MSKLKKLIKEDLVSKMDVELKIDSSILEPNTTKTFNKRKVYRYATLALVTSLVLLVAIPIISSLEVHDTYREVKRRYTVNEISLVEDSSFKSLNNITYPDAYLKELEISEEYKDAIHNFSFNVFNNLEFEDKNLVFSPLGLYSNLSLLSLSTTNEKVLSTMDNVLGLDANKRKDNFINMYQNDYFYNDQGTLQMYNAIFGSNKYTVSNDLLNKLIPYYASVYSLDFDNELDVDKMLNYINQRMNTQDYYVSDDLEINEGIVAYYMSLIYFNNKWANKFLLNDTYSGWFRNIKGGFDMVKYMKHKSFNNVYEYEKYYSIYDTYKNKMKIQYLLPKEDLDIFEVLQGNEFMKENEENLHREYIIDLSVPKFSFESLIDFSEIIKSIGLECLYENNSLNGLFSDLENVSLNWIKQKNYVSFNENSSVIKSSTISSGDNKSATMESTLEIVLNKPFVFVVYDSMNLPIYIGSVVNL